MYIVVRYAFYRVLCSLLCLSCVLLDEAPVFALSRTRY